MRSHVNNLSAWCALIGFSSLAPALADQAFDRGVRLYEAKNYAAAAESFTKSKDRANPILHYYLANSYASLKRYQDASSEYEACSRLNPDPEMARFCAEALNRYATLPHDVLVPPAKPVKSAPVEDTKPHKMSAIEWANSPDTPGPQPRQRKPSAQQWANTPDSPAAGNRKAKPAMQWANTPNGSNAAVIANPSPSVDARGSFERRVQDQIQDRKSEMDSQKAKSQELMDKATAEASAIRKQAQADEAALTGYGRKGQYYRNQMSQEIKEDAEARSKDVLQRAKEETQGTAKSARERERALNSSIQNLRAQMRGGPGKVRLDPSDSNLYVRNYK
jgi:hypothetical protein